MNSEVSGHCGRRLYDGVYINGSVEGVPVVFTADTGASKTLISTRVYQKIHEGIRPSLSKSASLRAANGEPIVDWGEAQFCMLLGSLKVVSVVKVAEIEDDVLLGYDILGCGARGAADILLSENKIVLGGVVIPCFQVGGPEAVRKATVADTLTIPGRSEALVDVYVTRYESDDSCPSSDFIIEPNDTFKERYQLLMAPSLVNVNNNATCKVRVLNPFSADVVLMQDAVIGKVEKIDRVSTVLVQKENESEEDNFNRIRRVNVVQSHPPNSPNLNAPSDKVPEHLIDLFKGKIYAEKQAVAGSW